ncbi:hypothetical protein L484_017247 [Morus notabilis]|uniref:Uncharacterized protein n=1 Tax=Morus notabilis TaxID=981085 RepID=W9RR33_9ROSA|nr:hypothetical protein L484_017247 [Morus notabilis]
MRLICVLNSAISLDQQAKPTNVEEVKPINVEETNDGKLTNQEEQDPNTEQKETNGHQVQDKV